MKKIFSLFVLSLILSFVININSSAQDKDEMMKMVTEWGNKIEQAMLNNDYETMYEIYADDIISLPSYAPMVRGLDNLKKATEESMEMNFTAFDMKPVDVFADGKYMYEIGTYTLTMDVPGMDMPFNDKGKYINIYEEQNDGSWKLKVETWNSDINPWEMMQDEPEE